VSVILVLVRFVHIASTMLLFGASAFLWVLSPHELACRLVVPVVRIIGVAIVVVGISALLWLGLEAGLMGDGWDAVVSPEILVDVLTGTAFGRVWQWRLALLILLIGSLKTSRQYRWALSVPASAMLLASLGLVGHANMQSGLTGTLHRASTVLHILAAGGWLGGLVPFVLCLRLYGDPQLRRQVSVALRRFSRWGHGIVALIVMTGAVNTALTLGAWPIDLSSPYQLLLDAKIAIVAAMIAIAIFNRYVLVPRVKFETTALRALANNSVGEIILGGIALALVSAFGVLEPV
jgi:putative copper resistance protein D